MPLHTASASASASASSAGPLPAPWANGLEDVVAAATRLSDVDGVGGRLSIAGRSLDDLDADDVAFIDIASALMSAATGALDAQLAARYQAARAGAVVACIAQRPSWLGHSDPLQAVAAALCAVDPHSDGATVMGQVHAAVACWLRGRRGLPLRAPHDAESTLSAGAWVLAIAGDSDDGGAGRALDRYFAVVCDHGLNASTFAARVVASTGASLPQAVLAAAMALAGPLHGGAPGPVLDLFDDFARGGPTVLQRIVDDGGRLMGFGHRVYRTRDPRAAVLERVVRALLIDAPAARRQRLDSAAEVERAALALLRARHPTRPLEANVEFFTAVLLEALAIERDAFTALFACGRVAGWCAHVAEQRRVGRLIRPRSIAAAMG